MKGLLERVEESSRWVEERRKGVTFTPRLLAEVEDWESRVKVEESPLGRYIKVQRRSAGCWSKRCVVVLNSLGSLFLISARFTHRQERARTRSWKTELWVRLE